MTERIRRLLSRIRDTFREIRWPVLPIPEHDRFTVRCLYQGDLRMTLTAFSRRCGHRAYLVEIDFLIPDERGRWLPIATFDEDDVVAATELLQEAALAIEQTPAEKAAPMWLTNGLR